MKIIDEPAELLLSTGYNEGLDAIYQLGPQIKMKVVIETINTTRTQGLKGDLEVGEYSGEDE